MKLNFAKSLIFISFISIFAINAQDFGAGNTKFDYYKSRYKVDCVSDKITDNHGNGFSALYGTRNMRTILFGVAYRGGANNAFNIHEKRNNHNPLPEEGLENLLKEGFSKAVYLYGTNFSSSKKLFINKEKHDTLRYIQNSGNDRKSLETLMHMIKEIIDNPNEGPIYLHCWNGWHQSGYVSAAILMQFCKYSNEEALAYWIKNTDGVNKGYENVKNKVKNFKPFENITISDEIREKICPCMK